MTTKDVGVLQNAPNNNLLELDELLKDKTIDWFGNIKRRLATIDAKNKSQADKGRGKGGTSFEGQFAALHGNNAEIALRDLVRHFRACNNNRCEPDNNAIRDILRSAKTGKSVHSDEPVAPVTAKPATAPMAETTAPTPPSVDSGYIKKQQELQEMFRLWQTEDMKWYIELSKDPEIKRAFDLKHKYPDDWRMFADRLKREKGVVK